MLRESDWFELNWIPWDWYSAFGVSPWSSTCHLLSIADCASGVWGNRGTQATIDQEDYKSIVVISFVYILYHIGSIICLKYSDNNSSVTCHGSVPGNFAQPMRRWSSLAAAKKKTTSEDEKLGWWSWEAATLPSWFSVLKWNMQKICRYNCVVFTESARSHFATSASSQTGFLHYDFLPLLSHSERKIIDFSWTWSSSNFWS